jgi:hypothetical protein
MQNAWSEQDMQITGWLKKYRGNGVPGRTGISYRYEVDSTGSRNAPMTVCVMSVMNTVLYNNKEIHPDE